MFALMDKLTIRLRRQLQARDKTTISIALKFLPAKCPNQLMIARFLKGYFDQEKGRKSKIVVVLSANGASESMLGL